MLKKILTTLLFIPCAVSAAAQVQQESMDLEVASGLITIIVFISIVVVISLFAIYKNR